MPFNFKRDSQNQNKKSLLAQLFDFEGLDYWTNLVKNWRDQNTTQGDNAPQPKDPPWMIRTGAGTFDFDIDKMEEGSKLKEGIMRDVKRGTHYIYTEQKPDGTTFRTIASHPKNAPTPSG